MSLSFWQVALVVLLGLLLFGRGKIPQLMADMAEGIKSFKKGMAADEEPSVLNQDQKGDSAVQAAEVADQRTQQS